MHIRNKMRLLTIVLLLSLTAATASAYGWAKPAMVTEKIEWTWAQRPENPNHVLPNVLLLGDSIAQGYYPEVAQKLAGLANCYLFATSASAADPRLAGQLQAYFHMAGVRFSVIHFNNGMHGWGYSEAQYALGLAGLVADLKADAPGAKLIWASTTPVQTDSKIGSTTEAPHGGVLLGPHGNGATDTRIEARNAAAAKLMRANHIPIDDQYSLMTAHANLHRGRVHYTAAGSVIQAEQLVKLIALMLLNH